MSDLPPYPDIDDDTGVGADRGSTTSRWVYVFWIVGIAVVVLFIVLHLTGTIGPEHH